MRQVSFGNQWLGILSFLILMAPVSSAQSFGTVSYPGAAMTGLYGINDQGVAVGYYNLDNSTGNQAILLSQGTFTNISVPSSTDSVAFGINDSGDVVGFYLDSVSGEFEGFLLSGGNYTTVSFPGSIKTQARGINNTGQIVGTYQTSDGNFHGFQFFKGVYTTIDCPCGQTEILNISNSGIIVGYYLDPSNVVHGLEYSSGVFTTLDFPGANNSTVVTDINASGTLVGTYFSATNTQTGFKFANGQFSTLNAPPLPYQAIDFAGINDSGQIVAEAVNLNGGFSTTGLFLSTGPYAYVGTSTGISVYDTAFILPVASIPTPSGEVSQLTPSPDGSVVYGTSWSGSVIYFIDTQSNTVTATIPTSTPQGLAITPNGATLYVANFDGNSVTAINTATKSVIATIPSPTTGPTTLVVSPDGKTVYVNHDPIPAGAPNAITVIDTATNQVTGSITGVGTYGFGIAISPDGKTLYVSSDTSVGLQYIDIATGTVTQTVSVPAWYISLSPDGSRAYVGGYGLSSTTIVDLLSGAIVATVPVQTFPWQSAVTPDGAFVWQANSYNSTATSIISTASNAVVATVPGANGTDSGGVAIPSSPATSQTITQLLSPTAPNVFNFGPHNFTVQYPAGTNFSDVAMTVVAAQASQATFKQRVVGTSFANAACIVYSGEGGNCEDYEVTCSSTSGGTISCPSESTPSITVKTSFDTQQQIINPGLLTTPIGTNDWTNIFEAFYLQRIDPTMKGRTKGFSEFVAVDLGAGNGQGAGTLTILDPLKSSDLRIFPLGSTIPVEFTLSSVATPSTPITDASASIAVIQTSDASGNPTTNVVLDCPDAFRYFGGKYVYSLNTRKFASGTYNITIYGNAFAATQVQFTLPTATKGVRLITTVQSVSLDATNNQYQVTLTIQNAGKNVADGVEIVSASLDGGEPITPLPVSLGDIAAGSSVVQTLVYPIPSRKNDNCGELTILIAYSGGNSAVGLQIKLP